MGSRGALPQPAKLKVIRGNPGRRPIVETAGDTTPVEAPVKPRWLQGAAATEWKRVTRELVRQQRLATTDLAALAVYCDTYARFAESAKALDEGGSTNGGRKSPQFAVWSDLNQRLLAASQALGLNVNARFRLPATGKKKEADPLSGLID